MSLATDADAKRWAQSMQDQERVRSGASIPQARRIIARRIGIAPGTLENLDRGRGKGLRGWIRDQIRAAFCREIEAEIARLSHVLAVARLSDSGASPAAIREAETSIANARSLIEGC